MQAGYEMHPSFFISETESRFNPAYRARLEDTLEVSLQHDMLMRASACADSQGITLDEFINRAITEKVFHVGQKSLKNGRY
jgi:predicted HicB family RNase H-like nuclease